MALSLHQHSMYPSIDKIATILKKRMLRAGKRSSGVLKENIGDSIPEDLLTEILSRLPVKTLLQFKVICKSWYAIIKSPNFITKHLKNYYRNNDDCCDCLIAQFKIARFPITQANELDNYALLLDYEAPKVLLAYEKLCTPMAFSNTYICGPCDGLYYYWCRFKKDDGRYLWNPTLNEYKKLPSLFESPNFPSYYYECPKYCEYFGFGYNPLPKDYKVIIIKNCIDSRIYKDWSTSSEHRKFSTSIFIYSLWNDSWRHWGELNGEYYVEPSICYIFVNDSVYWLAKKEEYREYNLMVGFNLATDEFQEWKLPNYEKADYDTLFSEFSLAVCYNSVALLIDDYQQGTTTNRFVLWTFNEGSWTKKHTINLNCNDDPYSPLGHWKDNKLLFYECRTIIIYDLETQETRHLVTPYGAYCAAISAYKESLVSVLDRKMWEN